MLWTQVVWIGGWVSAAGLFRGVQSPSATKTLDISLISSHHQWEWLIFLCLCATNPSTTTEWQKNDKNTKDLEKPKSTIFWYVTVAALNHLKQLTIHLWCPLSLYQELISISLNMSFIKNPMSGPAFTQDPISPVPVLCTKLWVRQRASAVTYWIHHLSHITSLLLHFVDNNFPVSRLERANKACLFHSACKNGAAGQTLTLRTGEGKKEKKKKGVTL